MTNGRGLARSDVQMEVVNLSEDQGNGWWSQRDLNPCLSLESRYKAVLTVA